MPVQRLILTPLLLLFSTSLALADIVPVSANRQISVSGSYSDSFDPGGSFAVSDSSQSLGLYDQTRSGSFFGSSASVDGTVSQTSNATSNVITLTTDGLVDFGGVVFGGCCGVLEGDSSSFSLNFTLTSASTVHIFGSATLSGESCSGGDCGNLGATGSGSQSIGLTGPGVNFEPSIPDFNWSPPPSQSQTIPIDATFILMPGIYALTATSSAEFMASQIAGTYTTSFDMSLTADFTPTVPEPPTAVPALLGVVAAIGWRIRLRVRA
jgi:hypothetical protein